MSVMKEFSELNLWEISHYWHDVSPNQTRPSHLPVEVEKTVRALAGGASVNLYFRLPQNHWLAPYFHEQSWALLAIKLAYKIKLQLAYRGLQFDKKFLSSLIISRTAIASWCKTSKVPLPDFWFDTEDPLIKKDIKESDVLNALNRDGLFQTIALLQKAQPDSVEVTDNQSDASTKSTNEELVAEAMSRLNQSNALLRYGPLHDIKKKFIKFYFKGTISNRSESAKLFIQSLSSRELLLLVPSHDKHDMQTNLDKGVRTLTNALRDYEKEEKPAWLNGFTLDDI